MNSDLELNFGSLDFQTDELRDPAESLSQSDSDDGGSSSGSEDFAYLESSFSAPLNDDHGFWKAVDASSAMSCVDRLSAMASSQTTPTTKLRSDGDEQRQEGDGFDVRKERDRFYLDWIDSVVNSKAQGGGIAESALYDAMKAEDPALFAAIADQHGSPLSLIMSHPDRFKATNSAPFQWSIAPARRPAPPSSKKQPANASPAPDQEEVDTLVRTAQEVLKEAPRLTLKSVELANAVRADLGTATLARAKLHFGGLLSLLALYPEAFSVQRIPKNDMVTLVGPAAAAAAAAQGSPGGQRADVEGGAPSLGGGGASAADPLALLTNERYVPGKPWPRRMALDLPYVRAATEALEARQRAAGAAPPRPEPVARLRAALRARLGLGAATVKSVPLKALLAAYPHLFVLCKRGVTLAAARPLPPPPLPPGAPGAAGARWGGGGRRCWGPPARAAAARGGPPAPPSRGERCGGGGGGDGLVWARAPRAQGPCGATAAGQGAASAGGQPGRGGVAW